MRHTKLLTVSQAARLLSISASTLRTWADRGDIPVVRLPSGYRRFEPAVIEQKRREFGWVTPSTEEDQR